MSVMICVAGHVCTAQHVHLPMGNACSGSSLAEPRDTELQQPHIYCHRTQGIARSYNTPKMAPADHKKPWVFKFIGSDASNTVCKIALYIFIVSNNVRWLTALISQFTYMCFSSFKTTVSSLKYFTVKLVQTVSHFLSPLQHRVSSHCNIITTGYQNWSGVGLLVLMYADKHSACFPLKLQTHYTIETICFFVHRQKNCLLLKRATFASTFEILTTNHSNWQHQPGSKSSCVLRNVPRRAAPSLVIPPWVR